MTACGDDSGKSEMVEPSSPGKADAANAVTMKVRLEYDEAQEGEFDKDLQFFGYVFNAHEGGLVNLEVTHLGSSQGLDTSLFVYGPRKGAEYGDSNIANDDDSGYGRLSKIEELRIEETGDYLVVVGTSNAMGRGKFRLLLTCENDQCIQVDESLLSECHDAIADSIDECITNYLEDMPYGSEEAVQVCTDAEAGSDWYDITCNSDWYTPPEFCSAGAEKFIGIMMPVCAAKKKQEYAVPENAIDLTGVNIPGPAHDNVDVAKDDCYSCEIELAAYSYEESAVTLDVALESVRAIQEYSHEWSNDGSATDSTLYSELEDYGLMGLISDVEEGLEITGAAHELGQLTFSGYIAAGAEVWTTTYVLLYADSRKIVTLSFTGWED